MTDDTNDTDIMEAKASIDSITEQDALNYAQDFLELSEGGPDPLAGDEMDRDEPFRWAGQRYFTDAMSVLQNTEDPEVRRLAAKLCRLAGFLLLAEELGRVSSRGSSDTRPRCSRSLTR